MWTISDKKIQMTGDEQNFTFLAKGVHFKGVLKSEGTVRIDGSLEGEIHTDGAVIVGEHAVIQGTVSAGIVMTSGKINGTVTATDKVQLLKPGVFIGDIRTPAISIEEGAHFHGICDMGAQKWADSESINGTTIDELAPQRQKVGTTDL